MTIKKAHCFFEQSGTFKNAFKHYGIDAEDYDIQNNFGETDNVIDLFAEIEKGYEGKPSIFDRIKKDDLIMAFFPCIHFCDAKTLFFKCVHISQKHWSIKKKMDWNIEAAAVREQFFVLLMKLFALVDSLGLRMVLENPYNTSGMTYLENNFMNPTIIDKNRMKRGDFFIKPSGYWFIGCSPSRAETYQKDKEQRIIMKVKGSNQKGLCSEERSMISKDYALNFINDFLLGGGKRRGVIQQNDLFD
jgi:hypothetical protein